MLFPQPLKTTFVQCMAHQWLAISEISLMMMMEIINARIKIYLLYVFFTNHLHNNCNDVHLDFSTLHVTNLQILLPKKYDNHFLFSLPGSILVTC